MNKYILNKENQPFNVLLSHKKQHKAVCSNNNNKKKTQSIWNINNTPSDDVFEMFRENLILRNKVDLKICRQIQLAIGRRRPRVLIEFVEELFLKGKKKNKTNEMFLIAYRQ